MISYIYLNIIAQLWLLISVVVTVWGILTIYYPTFTPSILANLFKYGKASESSNIDRLSNFIQVPKKWFSHFYIFASVYFTYLAYCLWDVYCQKNNPNSLFLLILNKTNYGLRTANVSPETTAIAFILIYIQVIRRCIECCWVSVYSKTKINIIHYLIGFGFYLLTGLSLFTEAPGFLNKPEPVVWTRSWITASHILGILIFLYAFYLQYSTNVIFANLRKNKKGKVVTLKHSIPKGGMFEYVSCPHYLAEVLLYVAVGVVYGGASAIWWFVVLWVVANQSMTALMTHQWYLHTYPSYPPQRRAIVPFLL